jgi:hypothetical protein
MIPKFINIIMSGALLAFLSSSVLADGHFFRTAETRAPETDPKFVPMTTDGRAELTELREDLTQRVNVIARLVAQDLGSDNFKLPKKFTVEVDTSEGAVHIEMEDIVVVGDGNGCASDPPGISCECPCPE